jgi:hypothetical protein
VAPRIADFMLTHDRMPKAQTATKPVLRAVS